MQNIAKLALSALFVLIATPLYMLLDLAVVGRIGARELASLGIGTLVLTILSTQLTFLSYGTTARSARRFGEGDISGAIVEGIQATWIALIAGGTILIAGFIVAPYLMLALVPNSEVAANGAAWLRIALLGVPLILVSMAGNGWMRGVQKTHEPVVIVFIGIAFASVFCVGLVHGIGFFPRLGLLGSAWANLVGQSITGTLFGAALLLERRIIGVSVHPERAIIRAQLVMGRDLIARSASFQICFLSAAAVASRYSVAAVAAHQVALQIWEFLSLILDSIAIAAQSVVGAALGAVKTSRAKDDARRAIILSVIVSALVAIFLTAGGSIIPRIFNKDPAVLSAIVAPWWFIIAMLPIAGMLYSLDGVLLGAGDVAFLRTATIASAAGTFLPLIWLSYILGWGLIGIWTGLLIFLIARLAAVWCRYRSDRWIV